MCLLLWLMPQLLNEETHLDMSTWMAIEQQKDNVYNNQISATDASLRPSVSATSPQVYTKNQDNHLPRQGSGKNSIVPESKQTKKSDEKISSKQKQAFLNKIQNPLPTQKNPDKPLLESRISEIAPIRKIDSVVDIAAEKVLPVPSVVLSRQQLVNPSVISLQEIDNGVEKSKQEQKKGLLQKQTNAREKRYTDKRLTQNLPAPAKQKTPEDTVNAVRENYRQPAPPDAEVAKLKLPASQDSLQVKTDLQEVHTKKKFSIPSALSFGLYFSPQYTYKRFIPNTNDELLLRKFRNPDNVSKERFGYETGLIIGKRLNRKLNLQLNLHYIQLSEVTQLIARSGEIDSVSVYEIVNASNFRVHPHYKDITWTYRSKYNYIGAGGHVSYIYWQRAGQQLYATMGGGINLLVKGKTQVYQDGSQVNNVNFPSPNNPFEQFNYRVSFSPGYTFTLYNDLKLFVEPTLHYFLGSTYKKREPVGIKPYTLGINVGITFDRGR